MKKTLLASALLASLLAACSSTPPAAPQQQAEVKQGTAETTTVTETKPAEPAKVDPWAALKDPNNILSKRSVYFDFDKYNVKDEYKEMLEAHAGFIKTNNAKILIQGNADERGSREYNLALGQKRANAVKQSLSILGVKEDQVEAVSLGEEKPRNTGHDEAAWAENRRGDILYNGEY